MENLEDAIARFRFAYLMTIGDKGPPHAVLVAASLQGGNVIVDGVGSRTRSNVLARPAVGLIWPPQSAADYSLIVDGEAVMIGESMRITPTRAVLHRPRPSPEPQRPGSCAADCVELSLASRPTGTR
jgi:hypothetical protein